MLKVCGVSFAKHYVDTRAGERANHRFDAFVQKCSTHVNESTLYEQLQRFTALGCQVDTRSVVATTLPRYQHHAAPDFSRRRLFGLSVATRKPSAAPGVVYGVCTSRRMQDTLASVRAMLGGLLYTFKTA